MVCAIGNVLLFSIRSGRGKDNNCLMGIPVLHDSIGGSEWDLINGGKRVGELYGL